VRRTDKTRIKEKNQFSGIGMMPAFHRKSEEDDKNHYFIPSLEEKQKKKKQDADLVTNSRVTIHRIFTLRCQVSYTHLH